MATLNRFLICDSVSATGKRISLTKPLTDSASDDTVYLSEALNVDTTQLNKCDYVAISVPNANNTAHEVILCTKANYNATTFTMSSCTRGVIAYGSTISSDSNLIAKHEAGQEISIPVLVQDHVARQEVFDGERATNGNSFQIGDGTATEQLFKANQGLANDSAIGFDASGDPIIYLADGSSFVPGAGAGAISGGDGIDVTSSVISADIAGTNDLLKITSGKIDTNLTASKTEIDQLAGTTNIAEANTFFGATDISGAEAETLTDGSNADTLHMHDFKEMGTNKAGTYFRFQCPSDNNIWTAQNCALIATSYPTINLDASSTSWLYKIDSFLQPAGYLNFTDEKELELEFFAIFTDADGDISIGTGVQSFSFEAAVRGAMFTYDDSANTLYARTGNGTNQESTDVTSGITVTNPNLYRIVHTPESVKYYINGSLVATHTTYINTVSAGMGFIACGDSTSMAGFQFTPPIVTIEL